MYFPYLRGRQFELIAVRELLEKGLLSNKVLPVIEPITISSTLINTLQLFIEKNQNIALIFNPEVGSFENEFVGLRADAKQYKIVSDIINNNYVFKTLLLNSECPRMLEEWRRNQVDPSNIIFIYHENDTIDIYDKYEIKDYKYIFIPDERSFRRKFRGKKILFCDRFIKQNRNADYQCEREEFFSDDFPYFQEEGYAGFSDYTIVGNNYSTEGFMPYAVVIHIVYFNKKRDTLCIRHFVSDSNDTARDPAKKYYEALTKLYNWWDSLDDEMQRINCSNGLQDFIEHYCQKSFSGLGVIKKLSIMHHLEIMGRYLNQYSVTTK